MQYAIINSGVVENIVLWDGEAEWSPPDDAALVPLEDNPLGVGIGWTFSDGVFTPPEEPAPEPMPQSNVPRVIAVAELIVENGEVSQVGVSCGIGFAMMLDTGVFWLFFSTAEPDSNYLPFVQSPGYNADVTERGTDYLEVTVYDRTTNEATTPDRLAITVQRTQ